MNAAMNQVKALLRARKDHFEGQCDPAFQDLAERFSQFQDLRPKNGGAALCVYFQGQKVVDIYSGYAGVDVPWQAEHAAMCYSTGKGVLATLAHILVSRGFLKYDEPIAHYWPEFAKNNKQAITLRHVLSHQSGLFDIRNLIQHAREMTDWQHMLRVFEDASPRFVCGQDNAYQALTFGWLVGGVLEKATGQTLASLMQQYLVEPLQLDFAYYGVPEHDLSRVARPFRAKPAKTKPVEAVSASPMQKKSQQRKTPWSEKVVAWTGQDPQDFKDAMIPKGMKDFSFFQPDALQAVIPAANGVFTARSLATIYAMLANGGQWQGETLIDPDTFYQLSRIQNFKRDRVMPIPMNWRLGYHRVLTLGKHVKKGFGHIGYNGSGAWCDPKRELSFAYIHNFSIGSITGDYRLWALTQETLRCADQHIKGRKGWF